MAGLPETRMSRPSWTWLRRYPPLNQAIAADARVVADDRLEDRRPAVLPVIDRLDQSDDRGRLLRLHLADLDQARREDPIPRKILQQIGHGANAELFKDRRPRRPHALEVLHRRRERYVFLALSLLLNHVLHIDNSFRPAQACCTPPPPRSRPPISFTPLIIPDSRATCQPGEIDEYARRVGSNPRVHHVEAYLTRGLRTHRTCP